MAKTENSVDELLERLGRGEEDAAVELFNRFAKRLLGLAKSRMAAKLQQKVDPEDVVQSVFRSFFSRQTAGEFDIRNEDGLWGLLAVITVRKCTNVRLRYGRKGRDIHLEVGQPTGEDSSHASWEALAREPSPEQAVVIDDLLQQLLSSFNEREKRIIELSLQGKSQAEISNEIGRAERTVRRTVDHFRHKLEQALNGE